MNDIQKKICEKMLNEILEEYDYKKRIELVNEYSAFVFAISHLM